MLARTARAAVAATSRHTARTQAFRAISTELQGEEHSKWLKNVVDTYPVKDIEHFEYSLEFMLGVPMPVHQFDLPPILVEVKNRNPDVDMDFH